MTTVARHCWIQNEIQFMELGLKRSLEALASAVSVIELG